MIESSKIISARELMNLTQMETSRRVGVSYAMYRLWEKGISKPNPDNEIKLRKALMIDEQEVSECNYRTKR